MTILLALAFVVKYGTIENRKVWRNPSFISELLNKLYEYRTIGVKYRISLLKLSPQNYGMSYGI